MADPRLLQTPREIRLFTSPVRQDVVEYLTAAGPSTVAEIAEAIGRPADSLYYHLRQLVEARLVVEEPETARGRRFRLRAERLVLRPDPGDPAVADAVRDVYATVLRSAERRVSSALDRPDAVLNGPDRNVWGSRVQGRLTPEELAEVTRSIERIHEVVEGTWGRAPGSGRMHEITIMLYPASDRPHREDDKTDL